MKKGKIFCAFAIVFIFANYGSSLLARQKLAVEPDPSYREDAVSVRRHPEVDTNVFLYINHWRNSSPVEAHGGLVERDILTTGDPLRPAKKGAVLKYIKAFRRGVLEPKTSSKPIKRDKEQVFLYVMSGTGRVEAGGKKSGLEEGTAVVIPAGLEYRFFNAAELPLFLVGDFNAVATANRTYDILVKDGGVYVNGQKDPSVSSNVTSAFVGICVK